MPEVRGLAVTVGLRCAAVQICELGRLGDEILSTVVPGKLQRRVAAVSVQE